MISTPITTLVTYVTNTDANAMDVLKACHRKSQGISDSKLNSAKLSPTYLIGIFGVAYMMTIRLENPTHDLDTGGSATPVTTQITATAAIKNLAKNPSFDVPQFSLLDHPDVQAYAKNPLDDKKRMRAELALKCNVVSTATTQKQPTIRPPFYVDYLRMANESGPLTDKTCCVTGEMQNEMILLPTSENQRQDKQTFTIYMET